MNHLIKPAREAFRLGDYPADALFFFDFDGVLADQEEEKVYRLEESVGEREQLEVLARFSGIRSALYDCTRYLRHLLFQAMRSGDPVEPHPEAVEFVYDLHETARPFFIVTARSGLYAVQRMMSFLDRHFIYPQELFCLGPLPKAVIFERLRQKWPDRPFVFFEDSRYQIDAVLALGDPLLTVVEIDWPTCDKQALHLRRQYLKV